MSENQPKKTIISLMTETRAFPPPPELAKAAYVKSFDQYMEMYQRSINEPDKFNALEWFPLRRLPLNRMPSEIALYQRGDTLDQCYRDCDL